MTKYLPHQLLMLADGFPPALFMTKEERQASWEANPPKFFAFIDPRLEAEKEMRAQQKKAESAQRIARMQISLAKKKIQKIDYSGLHWNSNLARYVDDEDKTFCYPPTTQKTNMTRLTVTPFNVKGEAIARGTTSVKADATAEQIDAQIAHAVKRGGASRVVRVEVKDKDGFVTKEWSADAAVVTAATADAASKQASAETAPAQASDQSPAEQSEEQAMAKKKTAAKTKAPSKRTGPTKVDSVVEMAKRASGVTLAQIKEKLGVSDNAAASLIGDVRRLHPKLKREKNEKTKVSTYSL